MTEADPDDIGPDGTVRLHCYLPMANSLRFFAGCQGRTVGELGRRLRRSKRQIGVTVQPDTRTAEVIERDGPAPETRAGLGD